MATRHPYSKRPHSRHPEGDATSSDRALLDGLARQIGTAGAAATTESPRLLAMLDQHVTATNTAMARRPRQDTTRLLAEYAKSVVASAHRMGQSLDPPTIDWTDPGWHVLRLLAVCTLAGTEKNRRPEEHPASTGRECVVRQIPRRVPRDASGPRFSRPRGVRRPGR